MDTFDPKPALEKYAGKLLPMTNLRTERKTGARGLRSILEAVLLDTMYDLPSNDEVSKVVIDENVINGDSDPMLIYENVDKAKIAQDE
mgnify:CR=1 FL=1